MKKLVRLRAATKQGHLSETYTVVITQLHTGCINTHSLAIQLVKLTRQGLTNNNWGDVSGGGWRKPWFPDRPQAEACTTCPFTLQGRGRFLPSTKLRATNKQITSHHVIVTPRYWQQTLSAYTFMRIMPENLIKCMSISNVRTMDKTKPEQANIKYSI